jgi:hypothetical protein
MRRILIIALGAALLVGCGGGGKTIDVSLGDAFSTMTPGPTATALPYAQYAQDFVTAIGWYQYGDSVTQRPFGQPQGELSAADAVAYQKDKDWILDLCTQTGLFPDNAWAAVFEAACHELGPLTPLYEGTDPYNRAIRILQNALNNGP